MKTRKPYVPRPFVKCPNCGKRSYSTGLDGKPCFTCIKPEGAIVVAEEKERLDNLEKYRHSVRLCRRAIEEFKQQVKDGGNDHEASAECLRRIQNVLGYLS